MIGVSSWIAESSHELTPKKHEHRDLTPDLRLPHVPIDYDWKGLLRVAKEIKAKKIPMKFVVYDSD